VADRPLRTHLGPNGLAHDFDIFEAVGVDLAQFSQVKMIFLWDWAILLGSVIWGENLA
jgi:hypothetical protein